MHTWKRKLITTDLFIFLSDPSIHFFCYFPNLIWFLKMKSDFVRNSMFCLYTGKSGSLGRVYPLPFCKMCAVKYFFFGSCFEVWGSSVNILQFYPQKFSSFQYQCLSQGSDFFNTLCLMQIILYLSHKLSELKPSPKSKC